MFSELFLDPCFPCFFFIHVIRTLIAYYILQNNYYLDYIKTTCVCPYYISTGMFAGVQVNISKSKIVI